MSVSPDGRREGPQEQSAPGGGRSPSGRVVVPPPGATPISRSWSGVVPLSGSVPDPAPYGGAAPQPRAAWSTSRKLFVLVMFLIMLAFNLYLLHSINSSSSSDWRQSDPWWQESDIVETDSVPWEVAGAVVRPDTAVVPSGQWLNGLQQAWGLDFPAADGGAEQNVRVSSNGSVLVTLERANLWQGTVKGWDVGGGAPRQLWSHTVQNRDSPDIGDERKSTWVGSTLFVGHYAVNADTGQIVSLTWMRQEAEAHSDKDLRVTADLMLVACDSSTGGCSGRRADGTVVWEASTGLAGTDMWGSAASTGHDWIWLGRASTSNVFLDGATGQVKTSSFEPVQRCWRAPAADGWLVACEGDSQIRALAADGTPVEAFDAAHWPVSTRSKHECSDASVPIWDQEPTLAQATAYYRDSDASATRGVLTPADCGHIEYQAPDGATTALDLTGDDEQRAFTLGDSGGELQDQLSVSDDGRVLAIGNSVLIDLTTGQCMGPTGNAPDRPALIAPALILTKTNTNLTATAPR